MDLLSQIIARAKSNKQRIVLPEGTEERTLKAADRLLADEVADLILIGNPEKINGLAAEWKGSQPSMLLPARRRRRLQTFMQVISDVQ